MSFHPVNSYHMSVDQLASRPQREPVQVATGGKSNSHYMGTTYTIPPLSQARIWGWILTLEKRGLVSIIPGKSL